MFYITFDLFHVYTQVAASQVPALPSCELLKEEDSRLQGEVSYFVVARFWFHILSTQHWAVQLKSRRCCSPNRQKDKNLKAP